MNRPFNTFTSTVFGNYAHISHGNERYQPISSRFLSLSTDSWTFSFCHYSINRLFVSIGCTIKIRSLIRWFSREMYENSQFGIRSAFSQNIYHTRSLISIGTGTGFRNRNPGNEYFCVVWLNEKLFREMDETKDTDVGESEIVDCVRTTMEKCGCLSGAANSMHTRLLRRAVQ